ncbi:MAG: FtsW/RodA/SpoVE family cell cycle protein [Peptococcaceae bacterium]|nr:FtsW/RodA/SpoVE family cell cycle protein [Peptococcaceae bacterium]
MFRRPVANLSLYLYPLAVLWVGIGILYCTVKGTEQILWQASLFSAALLAFFLLNQVLGYRGDRFLLPTTACLVVIGLVIITRIDPELARKQFLWATVGLGISAACVWGIRDYRRLGRYQYIWALLAIIMLAVTLFFGVTSGGATSWLELGGFRLEPEEMVKVAMIIFLANYLRNNRELLAIGTIQIGRFSVPEPRVLGPLAMMVGVALLLLAAQKSLGTALVFYGVALFMVYVATQKGTYLLLGIPVFLATAWLGFKIFHHVQTRVEIWLNPWSSVYAQGSQIAQSLFAIGNGGLWGMGLGQGFGAVKVPAAQTDFIFAVIAEELGFVGALAVILLFVVVIYRCFVIALKANDEFGTILAAGLGFLFAFEALIILAGVTKLLPLTGIPLPWVSYGGSSMLVHMFMLGCLSNISHVSERHSAPLQVKLVKGIAG